MVRVTFAGPAPGGRLVRVLNIDRSIMDEIVAHARRDHPDEACGVVAGRLAATARSGTSRWTTPLDR